MAIGSTCCRRRGCGYGWRRKGLRRRRKVRDRFLSSCRSRIERIEGVEHREVPEVLAVLADQLRLGWRGVAGVLPRRWPQPVSVAWVFGGGRGSITGRGGTRDAWHRQPVGVERCVEVGNGGARKDGLIELPGWSGDRRRRRRRRRRGADHQWARADLALRGPREVLPPAIRADQLLPLACSHADSSRRAADGTCIFGFSGGLGGDRLPRASKPVRCGPPAGHPDGHPVPP